LGGGIPAGGSMSVTRAILTIGRHVPAGATRAGYLAVAFAMVIGIGAAGCARPGPGTATTTGELLTQLQEDRTEIDKASDTMMKRIDMYNESRKPGEQTIQFSEIFVQDLNPEQRDVLDKLVQEEKDISYKTLLQSIIADRNTIRDLQDKVMHLEQSLPDKFVVAKRGDNHQNLAMTYLTGEAQLDTEKAKSLLKQVDQTDELVAGNQVWFFYDPKNDTFRTYVTRGEAGVTPVVVRRAKTRELVKERDTYRTERDTAQATAQALDVAKMQLESEIATRENSVYFHAASDATLKEQGVLSPVLKRVKDVKGVTFDQSMDLRQQTTIDLAPQTYGLSEIRSVRVLPSIYQEGRDFAVETTVDGASARIVILDPDVFRGKEVLVAIGG
jgi:hypothetical protein